MQSTINEYKSDCLWTEDNEKPVIKILENMDVIKIDNTITSMRDWEVFIDFSVHLSHCSIKIFTREIGIFTHYSEIFLWVFFCPLCPQTAYFICHL